MRDNLGVNPLFLPIFFPSSSFVLVDLWGLSSDPK